MGKKIGSEKLGTHYKSSSPTRTRREWRGFKDTLYDFGRWLYNLFNMGKFIIKPNNIKGMFRYRWMLSYTVTLDFIDRHTEGLRGPQLRMAHEEFDLIAKDMEIMMTLLFKADERIGNDKKLSKKLVFLDENMMTQVMNGFKNVTAICMELCPIYTPSTIKQDAIEYYIDVAEQWGLPGDVCPMPAGELGVAINDDYPICGAAYIHCNTTCDGSTMGNAVEMRRFPNIPHYQVAAPMKYNDPNVQDFSAQEIKDCIEFVEKVTGDKWDWDYYYENTHRFNEEQKLYNKWLEMSKTDRPQVIGNNIALYRDAFYQVAGGRKDFFLDTDKKIMKLAEEGYKKNVPLVKEVRHRAIVWGVQAQYYTAFSLWLQNCWGILPLIDMLSLTSLNTFSEDPNDHEQAYRDIAHLTENMTMRNRSNGGYQSGLYDCFKFAKEYNADIIIMYEHIGCKGMAGYHGLFDDLARENGIHLIWVTHGLMDPRKATRKDMRKEVNTYMRAVLKEEPLDASLEEVPDDISF